MKAVHIQALFFPCLDAPSIHLYLNFLSKLDSQFFIFALTILLDISDAFSEFGQVKNIHVNLDRRTGFCKGYALVEYKSKSQAQDAINALHGTELLGKTVHVDWAFVGSAADVFENRNRKQIRRR